MAENINVRPTPIQRNKFDVAIELTNLHLRTFGFTEEEVEKTFTKYYSLVAVLERTHHNQLLQFLPDEIQSKIKSN